MDDMLFIKSDKLKPQSLWYVKYKYFIQCVFINETFDEMKGIDD